MTEPYTATRKTDGRVRAPLILSREYRNVSQILSEPVGKWERPTIATTQAAENF
ncbi:MAG: hypothetical protein J7453_12815 [Thermomicrobium sp.]|nr:hypothetical protein [Thermomicrobium sp.]